MIFLTFKTKYLFPLLALMLLTGCGSGNSSGDKSSSATFTLSGSISINSRSDIDADVMNSGMLLEENNDFDAPQLLSVPVTLGGYLSGTEGTYQDSTSTSAHYVKDTNDFYRITLLEGQQVNVTTFLAQDGLTTVNVTFLLHHLDQALHEGEILPQVFTGEATQVITAPHDGEFVIELSAEEDVSVPVLYTLAISQGLMSNSITSTTHSMVRAEFVPGEVIVQFRDDRHLHTSSFQTKRKSMSTFETKHQLSHKRNIGKIGSVYNIAASATKKSMTFEANLVGTPQASTLGMKWQTMQAIEQLNADSDVIYAEPNYIYSASAIPPKVNDLYFDQQWGLFMIDAPAAWEASTGEGVTIAVIDTGLDADHIDSPTHIRDGYDFISDDASADDEEPGLDNNPHDTGPFLHGSHVTGIIAAAGNNNIGVAGVAYNATIMPLRVLGVDNKGTNSDIAAAILYAAGLPNDSGIIPTKSDIINLSLGGEDRSNLLEDAINKALDEGIIVVAAAGNEGSTDPHYPAAYDGVISVSSVNERKILSNFSNHGASIDVAGPGGTSVNNTLFDGFQDGILSTLNANQYAEYTGTSMAAPHASGVAALMKSIHENLNNNSFQQALDSGELTEDLLIPAFYGNGLINAAKSVNWALNSQGDEFLTASLSIFPTTLGFVGANTESSLELKNPGSGEIIITDITTDNDWIEINKSGVDLSIGLGKYPIKVNSAVLAPNQINNGEIEILYSIDGAQQVPITIDVFNSNIQQTNSTVGAIFVSLSQIDEDLPENPLQQFAIVEAVKDDNQYIYSFNNVPKGTYLLRASSNNDGDVQNFDAGEARGQYPLFSQPEHIQVNNGNLSDLDFSVQYQTFIQPASIKAR